MEFHSDCRFDGYWTKCLCQDIINAEQSSTPVPATLWRPFEDDSCESSPITYTESVVNPDWDPFPLRTRREFEELEDLLRRSEAHFDCLVQYFRDHSYPERREQYLRFWIHDEAVVHFNRYTQLSESSLFTAIYCAWVAAFDLHGFKNMVQRYLRSAKTRNKRLSRTTSLDLSALLQNIPECPIPEFILDMFP